MTNSSWMTVHIDKGYAHLFSGEGEWYTQEHIDYINQEYDLERFCAKVPEIAVKIAKGESACVMFTGVKFIEKDLDEVYDFLSADITYANYRFIEMELIS